MPKFLIRDDAHDAEFVVWADDAEDAQYEYIEDQEAKGIVTGNLRVKRAPEPKFDPRHFGHWIGGPL